MTNFTEVKRKINREHMRTTTKSEKINFFMALGMVFTIIGDVLGSIGSAIGSIFNKNQECQTPIKEHVFHCRDPRDDMHNIARDWQKVGNDLRNAEKRFGLRQTKDSK